VTFDAMRLDPESDLTVTFALAEQPTGPASVAIPADEVLTLAEASGVTSVYTVSIPASVVVDWQAQVSNAGENTDTDGEPYKTIATPIDTVVLDHGLYTMSTTVQTGDGEPATLGRTVRLSLMNQMFFENWEDGFRTSVWSHAGLPSAVPNIYGDAVEEDNQDVIRDAQSLELQGDQVITMAQDTTGRHDIRLLLDAAALDLSDEDALVVSWSKGYWDGSYHWTELFSLKGEDAPSAFDDPIVVNLPNGLRFTDPEAWADLTEEEQAAPGVLGADDNPNFRLRIELYNPDDNEDARGYIDNIEIRGT
jgi:hypothetical protein